MKTTYDERLMPADVSDQLIYNEHQVRYQLASMLACGKEVLDVASGEGYGTAILAKVARKAVGVDISQQAVDTANAKYAAANLRYICDSAEILAKIPDASMDLIVSFETIEHLPNYDSYLAALTRVLKKDGLALISTPNKDLFHEENPYHIKEFSRQEFTQALEKHFKTVKIYDQSNGLASMISAGGQNAQLSVTSRGEAQYFIALCALDAQSEASLTCDMVSFNADALARRDNNPGWKLINRLYKIYKKFI